MGLCDGGLCDAKNAHRKLWEKSGNNKNKMQLPRNSSKSKLIFKKLKQQRFCEFFLPKPSNNFPQNVPNTPNNFTKISQKPPPTLPPKLSQNQQFKFFQRGVVAKSSSPFMFFTRFPPLTTTEKNSQV